MTPTARHGSTAALLAALGVDVDPESLVLALTHRSFAHEAGGLPTNERLEFLGDAVIGLVVTEFLFQEHQERPEGDLAKMRAATVSQRSLADLARKIGLGPHVLLGRGETSTGGGDKDSILSDTFEALIGAVFVNHGLEVAKRVVLDLMVETLDRAATLGAGLDWKTSLQELAAELELGLVHYLVESTGPDHARVFHARVQIGERILGVGTGSAKKVAEQAAAETAYLELKQTDSQPTAK